MKRSRLLAAGAALATGAVLFTTVPALSAGADRTSAAVNPGPTQYHLRVRAVLASDNDGTEAATITPAQISDLISRTNDVWKESGLVFDFDPATDTETVKSTLLNNDCVIVGTTSCDKVPVSQAREQFALDPARDGAPYSNEYSISTWSGARVVIFFRYGGESFTCNPTPCRHLQATGAFSSRAGHYVVMPTAYPTTSPYLLAHELGHYIWNTHTFRDNGTFGASAITSAANYMKQWVESKGLPKDRALEAFDGDVLDSTDTPPDAGTGIFNDAYNDGKECDPARATRRIPVTFTDGTKWTFTLQPDRGNIMSYFIHCDLGHHASAQQLRRARSSVTSWNRTHLTGRTPSYARLDRVYDKTSQYVGATLLAPYESNYRTHLLSYKTSNGAVRIERIADAPSDGRTLIWSGTWTTGYTNIVPLRVGSTNLLVLYRASNGAVKVVRVNADNKGVTTLANYSISVGISSLSVLNTPTASYVVTYSKGPGVTRFFRMTATGGMTQVNSGGFVLATGATSIATGNAFDGKGRLFLYNSANGETNTYSVSDDALTVTSLSKATLPTGLTRLKSLRRGAQSRLVGYSSTGAQLRVFRLVNAGTSLAAIGGATTSEASYAELQIVRIGALWYSLLQNPTSGRLVLHQITQ